MRTISCSTSRSIRGRPGLRRAFEPSNLWAISLRYQARMVSGRATLSTSARAFWPTMTDLGERTSLRVRDLQPPFQLVLQDPIFSDQIFPPPHPLLFPPPPDQCQ